MTGATESRLGHLPERFNVSMDNSSTGLRIERCLEDSVLVRVGQHVFEDFVAQWPVDGLCGIAADECLPSGTLAPRLVDAMAHDAGDTFA